MGISKEIKELYQLKKGTYLLRIDRDKISECDLHEIQEHFIRMDERLGITIIPIYGEEGCCEFIPKVKKK